MLLIKKNKPMDLNLYFELFAKKLFARYHPICKWMKREYVRLRELLPEFLKEKLVKSYDKRVLFASMGSYDAKTEGIYLKALETIGYEPCVITGYDPYVKDIFSLYGIKNVYYYEDYLKKYSANKLKKEAEFHLKHVEGKEVLNIKMDGISVGKYAASSFMRMTRNSTIKLNNDEDKILLLKQMIKSLRAAKAVKNILQDIKPDLLLAIDRGYTPVGQLFDACLLNGIPVITRNASHKSGWEIVKRYSSPQMSTVHPQSLSSESWEYIKKMPWNDSKWNILYKELFDTYRTGDWFAEVGTQFGKKMYSKKELLEKLQLDENKKTAIIFPHMFWDATFFWGEDLFEDYYDWFVNVLKVAAKNKSLNWIIKIHPANVIKAKRDNYKGVHKELAAVYETLGSLPEHIKVIPPESDINTFSLFSLMDYCLTVRGTIGIEASMMGINTITAGTGRYDRLGFTHDFNSKEEYLDFIRNLQDVPPMNEQAIELARRFAYGIFILRPIHLDLLDLRYNQDEKASMSFKPLFKNIEEFKNSKFVQGLKDFVISGKEDYLDRDRI